MQRPGRLLHVYPRVELRAAMFLHIAWFEIRYRLRTSAQHFWVHLRLYALVTNSPDF
jgi:hypothetical protein